jgi:Protein of unknown function (DUF4058)
MKGPFPGIDPYIEARFYWRDFHNRFLTYLADALNVLLPPHYDARIDERVSLVEENVEEGGRTSRLPDVAVVQSSRQPQRQAQLGTAVAEVETVPETIPLVYLQPEVERYLKITHWPDQSVVVVIELLSPTNKREGHGDYLRKRDELLHQPVHLVELDFLLGGRRMPLARPLPKGDYFAMIARAERRPDCQVYSWSVRQPPPRIALPLKAPDPDLRLDLAPVLATACERSRYPRADDYKQPLGLPLAEVDSSWAENLARGFAEYAKK